MLVLLDTGETHVRKDLAWKGAFNFGRGGSLSLYAKYAICL